MKMSVRRSDIRVMEWTLVLARRFVGGRRRRGKWPLGFRCESCAASSCRLPCSTLYYSTVKFEISSHTVLLSFL